ncbi:MAG: hypothetical protein K0S61_3149 [Anaerocolumna sp.]|jgi:hypothetical protein|nr:hypothetical protein [Anaerocolumna sp.]
MNYIINFSWKGLLIFALAMLPNIYYFKNLNKEANTPKGTHKLLDILEHGSQMIFVVLLIFIVSERESSFNNPFVLIIGTFLLIYYILWIYYIRDIKNLIILEGLAIVPVLYFLASEYWLYNYFAMIPTVLFGAIHSIITYKDYKTL